jgi:hypothetical protein
MPLDRLPVRSLWMRLLGRRLSTSLPGELGRFSGDPAGEENSWRQELQAVYETWKRPLHKPSNDA